MLSVTAVDPFVAGITLLTIPLPVKTQLLFVRVGSVGTKLQLSVTATPKFEAGGTGATVKAYPVPGTPASTVEERLPVLFSVKLSGLTTSLTAGEVLPLLFTSPP
jgi:hypothetical protein